MPNPDTKGITVRKSRCGKFRQITLSAEQYTLLMELVGVTAGYGAEGIGLHGPMSVFEKGEFKGWGGGTKGSKPEHEFKGSKVRDNVLTPLYYANMALKG